MSLDVIGWLGSFCFAICASPQAIKSIKQGHSNGVVTEFLLMWMAGSIFTMIYMWPKQDWPILTSLFFNLLFITAIVYYKIWPRSANEEVKSGKRKYRRGPRIRKKRRNKGNTNRSRQNVNRTNGRKVSKGVRKRALKIIE